MVRICPSSAFFVPLKEEHNIIWRIQDHLDPYIREKATDWTIAIGQQRVDGHNVSDFLIEVACQEIEGKITMNEALAIIDEHYEQMNFNRSSYEIVPLDSKESKRIAEYNKARRPELYK